MEGFLPISAGLEDICLVTHLWRNILLANVRFFDRKLIGQDRPILPISRLPTANLPTFCRKSKFQNHNKQNNFIFVQNSPKMDAKVIRLFFFWRRTRRSLRLKFGVRKKFRENATMRANYKFCSVHMGEELRSVGRPHFGEMYVPPSFELALKWDD